MTPYLLSILLPCLHCPLTYNGWLQLLRHLSAALAVPFSEDYSVSSYRAALQQRFGASFRSRPCDAAGFERLERMTIQAVFQALPCPLASDLRSLAAELPHPLSFNGWQIFQAFHHRCGSLQSINRDKHCYQWAMRSFFGHTFPDAILPDISENTFLTTLPLPSDATAVPSPAPRRPAQRSSQRLRSHVRAMHVLLNEIFSHAAFPKGLTGLARRAQRRLMAVDTALTHLSRRRTWRQTNPRSLANLRPRRRRGQ